jgi:hypothetical protein
VPRKIWRIMRAIDYRPTRRGKFSNGASSASAIAQPAIRAALAKDSRLVTPAFDLRSIETHRSMRPAHEDGVRQPYLVCMLNGRNFNCLAPQSVLADHCYNLIHFLSQTRNQGDKRVVDWRGLTIW